MDALERTFQPTRRVLGDVDPAQPLDPTHPLTDGLQGFWLPLPRLVGGSRLYDLSAHGRHATINHGAGAWRNGTFNTPSLVFGGDETDDYAFLSSPPVDIGVTVSVYISVPQSVSVATSRYDQVFRFGQDDILLTSYSNHLSASGQAQGKIWDGSDEHEVVGTDIRGQGPTLLTMTWGMGGMKLYENGVQVDSNSFTGSPDPLPLSNMPTGDQDIIIGWGAKKFNSFEGQIAHVYWADRSLSPRQVSVLYDQARRGFPDLLNRRDTVGLLGGGGGGTTIITTSLSDTTTFSESTSNRASILESCADTITISDLTSAFAAANTFLSGNVALSDSISASAVGIASVAVSDTLTLTDSQAVTAVLSVGQSSTLTATEDASVVASALSQRSDTFALSDEITVGAGVFAESVTDAITFSSTETESATIPASSAETVTVTDSRSLSPILTASQSESLTFSTTQETLTTITEAVSDVLGLSENIGDIVVIDAKTGETLTFTSTTAFIVEVLTVPDSRKVVVFPESRVVVITEEDRNIIA